MNTAENKISHESPAEETDPASILARGLEAARGPVALACSFGVEDVVLIDFISFLKLPIRIFAIDTGRLNEETYQVAETVSQRYGVEVDWYFPERAEVERLEREKGMFSFRESLENRKECCQIRKVEPLKRALRGLAGWVTGLRREQNVTRANLEPLETDTVHGGILKINPLVHWTDKEVWDYALRRRVPINVLHQKGYPSIGCASCTRPIAPGEHPRAGRWWWEDPEHKECGLHR